MKDKPLRIPGSLVTLPIRGKGRPLDGFLAHGSRLKRKLLILVHGMGGNFYRSRFRKELLLQSRTGAFDALSFSNRGSDADVAHEKFRDCAEDIDAAIRLGKAMGYREFVLMGHSTGCQKVTYYQAVRKNLAVKALILGSIGDDMAISRRRLKRGYDGWIRHARKLVARGRGNLILPPACMGFSAARFLSCADPRHLEAQLLNFDGAFTYFRRIRKPVLVLMGDAEEHACIPVEEMIERLRRVTRARRFDGMVIAGGDHGFHGKEKETARAVYRWLGKLTTNSH
ncbi:MAG TPA: alpha/beta fold hydrolase [Kiritimatiellia bacterium]